MTATKWPSLPIETSRRYLATSVEHANHDKIRVRQKQELSYVNPRTSATTTAVTPLAAAPATKP